MNYHPLNLWRYGGACGITSRRLAHVAEQIEVAGGGKGLFEGRLPEDVDKVRLDVWISQQLPHASRARVQDSIRNGLATVNGQSISKSSHVVKAGDYVACTLCGAVPLEAKPQDIALDIVYEDEHVIVVNKPSDMVVHPAPGHSEGTLVNAILYHCGLPAAKFSASTAGLIASDDTNVGELSESEDEIGGELSLFHGPDPVIRPGIVHRLDKGTSGLLIIAKDEFSHMNLSEQFKAHTIKRSYLSITCGSPSKMSGQIQVPIGRDPRDRRRMAALLNVSNSIKARNASSRYRVMEVLARGGAALVEWNLETGRTHQIRVHAKHLGYPLLGDELYGGTEGWATSKLLPAMTSAYKGNIQKLLSTINRPCLHAYSLGFVHPYTKQHLHFSRAPPLDFEEVWQSLRGMQIDNAC